MHTSWSGIKTAPFSLRDHCLCDGKRALASLFLWFYTLHIIKYTYIHNCGALDFQRI